MTALVRPIELCGCDTPTDGRLISVDVALARGLALARHPVASETVPLEAATGRVLAAPAVSPIPLPPFDNSAMDGYALRTADLVGSGPWCLPLAGRIVAGGSPMDDLPQGTAVRILTGAPVPAAADAVIMQEHVTREDDAIVVDPSRMGKAALNDVGRTDRTGFSRERAASRRIATPGLPPSNVLQRFERFASRRIDINSQSAPPIRPYSRTRAHSPKSVRCTDRA